MTTSVETNTTPLTRSSSAAVEGGTRQGVTDAGCGPHDPDLYNYQRIAKPCAATLQVSRDIVDQYHQSGYLVFDKAFAVFQSDLDHAVQALTSGSNVQFANDVRRQVNLGQTPSFTAGQQIAWVQYEAGTVLGKDDAQDCQSTDELELFQSQALLKPPGGGREKPWHQDNAYFDIGIEDTAVVGCWIAIDEATPDNGCLRMLSGGNKVGPRMHFAVRDYQICDDEILPARPSKDTGAIATTTVDVVAIALPPGGLVLFDGMVPHGTPTNLTNQRRRALQFHWIKKGTRRVGEKEPGGRAQVFGGAWNGLTC